MTIRTQPATRSPAYARGMEYLVGVIHDLSLARSRDDVVAITSHAARELTGSDGASFVLREGELCAYLDEEAIGPLWKGRRFPMSSCVSGWAMEHKKAAAIANIYADERVPHEAYRPTFVKSMVMVPIRRHDPIGALGNYWAEENAPTPERVELLEALADAVAVALENVRLVEDLRRTNETLAKALAAREEFITVASHELRTPLTSMNLQLQLLQRSTPAEDEKAHERLRVALRQSQVISGLVEKLFDTSQMRLGRVELEHRRVSLSGLLSEVGERMRPQLAASACPFLLDLDEGVEADCDPVRIEQVLVSLLANAAKYAPSAPVTMRLRRAQAGVIVFSVSDRGSGIPAAIQKRLFAAFERGVNSRHVSGLGLGLYVARSLVEAHGGRLLLESEEGKGASFTVELPDLKRV